MTASMPQPEKFTAAEVRDIADFIESEAMRIKVGNNGIASLDVVHLEKTARYLRSKAVKMEERS